MSPDIAREQFAQRVIGELEYRHFALRWLYQQQTLAERKRKITLSRNGAGFTAPDAPILSQLAEKLVSGGTLTAAEEVILTRKLPKYWSQFTETSLMNPPRRNPPSGAIARVEWRAA